MFKNKNVEQCKMEDRVLPHTTKKKVLMLMISQSLSPALGSFIQLSALDHNSGASLLAQP